MIIIGNKKEDELLSMINHHSCGAVVCYFGYVRDLVNKNKVKKMICKKDRNSESILKKIENDIQQKFPIKDIILYHSMGELDPDELVTGVIVSSVHRDEGFAACKYGIDKIKELEPIKRLDIFEE